MAYPPQPQPQPKPQPSEIGVTISSAPSAAAPPPAPPVPKTVEDFVRETARKYHVDEDLALATIDVESSGRHTRADGSTVTPPGGTAQGLFQLLPATAAGECGVTDPSNIFQNIECGVKYLRQGIDHGGGQPVATRDVARFYHGGPNHAQWGPVTDRYASDVLAALERRDTARKAAASAVQPPAVPATPPPPPGWLSKFASEASQGVRQVGSAALSANTAAARGLTSLYHDPTGTLASAGQSLLAGNRALGQGIVTAVEHPVDAYHRFFDTQVNKVRDAWAAGDYAKAALEAKNIPLQAVGMGTRLGEAEEFMRQGEYAKGLGASVDVGTTLAGPAAAEQVGAGGVRVMGRILKPRLTPAEAAANALGRSGKVPISASVASGSGFAHTAEYVAQSTPIGNVIARIKEKQMMKRMDALGTRLAGHVSAYPLSGAEAGRSALSTIALERNVIANETGTLYDALRAQTADPRLARTVQTGTRPGPFFPVGSPPIPVFETLQLPVDMRPIRSTLQPMRDDLARRRLLLNPAEEQALNTLDHFLAAPDYVPLSQAERDLGSLKAITRQADDAATRNVSQGTAAKGVEVLQSQIDAAAATAGPDVLDTIQAARESRHAQGEVQRVLDRLEGTHGEPISAFNRLTSPGNLEFLYTVAEHAPGEIPKLGRALLEDLFTKARGISGNWSPGGGWARMEMLASTWEALHPEIKQLLYGGNAKDLDAFFLLGRKIAQSPNPSGTGRAVVATGILTGAYTHPLTTAGVVGASGVLSAALNTEGGVRLLTEGLTIPVGTVRAAAWTAAVTRMVTESQKNAARAPGGQAAAPPPKPPGAQPSEIGATLTSEPTPPPVLAPVRPR